MLLYGLCVVCDCLYGCAGACLCLLCLCDVFENWCVMLVNVLLVVFCCVYVLICLCVVFVVLYVIDGVMLNGSFLVCVLLCLCARVCARFFV